MTKMSLVLIVVLTVSVISLCIGIARRHEPARAPWTEFRDLSRGFAFACPPGSVIQADAMNSGCLLPYGTVANAYVVAVISAKEGSTTGFVGSETAILDRRDVDGYIGYVTAARGTEGRELIVVKDGKRYALIADSGSENDDLRIIASFKFLNALQ